METPEKLAAVWANVTACALNSFQPQSLERMALLDFLCHRPRRPDFCVWEAGKRSFGAGLPRFQIYGAKFSDLLLELPYDTDYLLLQKARAGKDRGFLKRCLQEAGSPYLNMSSRYCAR